MCHCTGLKTVRGECLRKAYGVLATGWPVCLRISAQRCVSLIRIPRCVDLYEEIPVLDEEGLLRAMLLATDPHRFAKRIVDAVPRSNGHVSVSTEPTRELLKERPLAAFCKSRRDCT